MWNPSISMRLQGGSEESTEGVFVCSSDSITRVECRTSTDLDGALEEIGVSLDDPVESYVSVTFHVTVDGETQTKTVTRNLVVPDTGQRDPNGPPVSVSGGPIEDSLEVGEHVYGLYSTLLEDTEEDGDAPVLVFDFTPRHPNQVWEP